MYDDRRILFTLPGGEVFKYHGARIEVGKKIPIISAMKARGLLRNEDCEAFLLSFQEVGEKDIRIEDVIVVCEYPDIFPKDLLHLPPDHQIKFIIDLKPGTTPNSKTPYIMTSKGLQELKIQLQELL